MSYWKIDDKDITASSHLGPGYEPWMARVGNKFGSWCAATNDMDQYLQVDLGQTHRLGYMAVEGANVSDNWVKSFTLGFSTDGDQITSYCEDGLVKVFVLVCVCVFFVQS